METLCTIAEMQKFFLGMQVEFASFLKKRSELIEAGSPEDIKSNVLLNTIFKEKPMSMQAAFTCKLAKLHNACLREIGALQSFPKWETVHLKDSCKKFGEYVVENFNGAFTPEELWSKPTQFEAFSTNFMVSFHAR